MAYLDFEACSRAIAPHVSEPQIKIAASVALEIADKAADLQRRFLTTIGMTLPQAQQLSGTEKERLQRRYTEFLLS
ncbi:MAG: hypothetical protein DI537_32900 [Stutzerimonas stutzeri]|nr:MAG: hypothetical protein DI537_32900 [Stutzerimonas stutzeri]